VLPTKLESYDTRFSDFRGERVGGTVLYIPWREVDISTYFGKAWACNAEHVVFRNIDAVGVGACCRSGKAS